jgi:uncharacterized protein (DUF58 family)
MDFSQTNNISGIQNLELLAKQVVEGFITGMHKSPFHGFSVEFAEHRLYNKGESTRHIDWKMYGKTDKLFVKRYEEETNLRCHIIIDNSASMHYPPLQKITADKFNKIGFTAIATAVLLEILKRQRDAFGMSIYSEENDYYAPAKGNEKHRRMLLDQLSNITSKKTEKSTNTYTVLHEIADKIHRRSLIFLFTDMLQDDRDDDELFAALRHLKYNKHDVVLFHVFDGKLEYNFDFDQSPKKFVDVETGAQINLFADSVKEDYQLVVKNFFNTLKLKCLQYKIDYVPVDITEGYDKVLTSFLISRNRFI